MLHNPVTLHVRMLAFIDRFSASRGFPPSTREIADAMDFDSVGTVSYHLGVLEVCGLITRQRNCPRTIVVTQEGRERIGS